MYKFMSGIKPTGQLHLGNYINTIKPIIEEKCQDNTIILIADGHSLTQRTENIFSQSVDLAKVLYSFGLKNIVFQSQFPQIFELQWILSCYADKGLMNRAHGYKSKTAENESDGKDKDTGVNMGVFSYPVLMTADLCVFDSEYVFIGSDQIQHVEMAKEIVQKFNYYNKTEDLLLKVPKPVVHNSVPLMGLDGRKMSKSYDNTVSLMSSEELRKYVFSMKTNFKNLGEPKEWDESSVTSLYEGVADEQDCEYLKEDMKTGMGWGEVKQRVFDKINNEIKDARIKYNKLNNLEVLNVVDTCYFKIRDKIIKKLVEIKNSVYNILE